jgi:predicted aldo/keto reductase-like oxidoreductase
MNRYKKKGEFIMREITLGTTGITVPQNAFGALPVQRVSMEQATALLRRAYDGGMRFFDTARAYSDSEEKVGNAFAGMRDKIFIATKTMAHTPDAFWEQLEKSLALLQTDYIDIYQFHCVDQCYKPGDGTGMYECMLKAKEQGKIRHIGVTAHKLEVAFECVESGLYETLQYPFSYLAAPREVELVNLCREKHMGFIAMKGLAGGLITNSQAAMAFMTQFDNVLPIWGIQREKELTEWLSYMTDTPTMDEEITAFIEKEKGELAGEFCRGCGYCMPCPKGIMINQCARMSLMLRRAPSASWLSEPMQAEMKKIEDCIHCGSCMKKCPYSLNTPELLAKNYEDYKRVLAGEVSVS